MSSFMLGRALPKLEKSKVQNDQQRSFCASRLYFFPFAFTVGSSILLASPPSSFLTA